MTNGAPDHLKTVIFLGAGASAADGAPLQAELFRAYFQSAEIQSRVRKNMKVALERYFRQLWGIDVRGSLEGAELPTFEEALGILDIADSRKESFRGMGDDPHATGTQKLRNHLTALIGLIIQERLRRNCPHHIELVNHLQERGRLCWATFISLNYDIIIDNAIERVSINRGTQRLPDYGVDFTPTPHSAGRPFPVANLLLKLHGSLNWLSCPACNSLSLFPGLKVAAELPNAPRQFRCRECHQLRMPVVVPPTFFKVMSDFYLQQIWKRAEEELKRAERIIFCGYSFPDADIHVKYLLKRAEVNRTGEVPEVFIVNEHRGKKKQQREMERDRYMRFFRQKNEVHWTKLSFEKFAANPNLIEDTSRWL